MSDMAGIERRYSCFAPADDPDGDLIDREGTSARGSFAGTGKRMQMFEAAAPGLAQKAIDRLLAGEDRSRITHLIVTCCTGLSSPGLDLEIMERCKLPSTVERTFLGFMGCYAAINAFKLARHIVRSEPEARVLVVSLELCTLHMKEQLRSSRCCSLLLWGDGCAACLVTAEPKGLRSTASTPLAEEDARPHHLEHPQFGLRHAAIGAGTDGHSGCA